MCVILRAVSYLGDLGITLAVELPVVVAVAVAAGLRARTALAAGLVANALTHPLLWFVVAPWAYDRLGVPGVAIAEALVVAVEATVYRRRLHAMGSGLCISVAALANALSWGIGLAAHAARG